MLLLLILFIIIKDKYSLILHYHVNKQTFLWFINYEYGSNKMINVEDNVINTWLKLVNSIISGGALIVNELEIKTILKRKKRKKG